MSFPLILAAGAGAAWLGSYAWNRMGVSDWAAAAAQAYGGAADPSMRPAPGPQFSAPLAPQTPGKLTTWTPDDLLEAVAQRNVQFGLDQNYLAEVMQDAAGSNPAAVASDSFPWLLVGLAGGALWLVLKR